MRIVHRIVKIKETNDGVETHITERIVEDDHRRLIAVVPGSVESDLSGIKVKCDVCTHLFDYDNTGSCCCPSCGSRSVGLA